MRAISSVIQGFAGMRSRSVDLDPGAASSRRLMLLLTAMFLMGMGDLLCTLAYMRSVGLPEMNPIARWIAANGTSQSLVLYKLLTISVSCGALYLARRHRRAEVCGWACAAILFALTLHWISFNRSVSEQPSWLTLVALDANRQDVARAGMGPAQDIWVSMRD